MSAPRPEKVFVSGCASFIGAEFLRLCAARGIETAGADLNPPAGPLFVKSDVRDPAIADAIPERVDAIVHLAAMSRDPDCRGKARQCFDVNVMGTLNMIEAAERRRARQFVFASSEWVYEAASPSAGEMDEDEPLDPSRCSSEYALSKLVSEANLRQKHRRGFCPVAILRFGITYGPRRDNWSAVESLFFDAATKDVVTVGSARTARRFTHVADIASGILASVGLEGFNVVNIAGDRLVSLGDIVETTGRLTGRRPSLVETAPQTPSVRNVSNARARALLGWRPAVDLERGLRTLMCLLPTGAAPGEPAG